MIYPREYQTSIVSEALCHYGTNDKGVIVMPCGSGKTITSLMIAKGMKIKRMVVFVPSILLVKQWLPTIKEMFPDKILGTTPSQSCDILVMTYHSSYKIYNHELQFDLAIYDECHHLSITNTPSNKSFRQSLEITTGNKLFITATFKKTRSGDAIYNDNITYFGNIFAHYTTGWAIANKIITDYRIQLMMFDKKDLTMYESILEFVLSEQIYMSVLVALQNIQRNTSTHILIYANTIANANLIIKYIDLFLEHKYFELNDIEYFAYTSKNKPDIRAFERSKFGIIACVYSLGEGFDLPILDTVIFSENMSSEIRIIQSALRPCRLYQSKHEAKIILPLLCDKSKCIPDDFRKVKKVISEMIADNEEYVKSNISICHQQIRSKNEKNDFVLTMYNKEAVESVISNIIVSKNDFKQMVVESNFINNDFTFSKIIDCRINQTTMSELSYAGVIKSLYNHIGDSDLILKHTTLGPKTLGRGKHPLKSVGYIESLNIYTRGINANTAIVEFITLSKTLNLNVSIEIVLKCKNQIKYSS